MKPLQPRPKGLTKKQTHIATAARLWERHDIYRYLKHMAGKDYPDGADPREALDMVADSIARGVHRRWPEDDDA